jgi:hypothetical protein
LYEITLLKLAFYGEGGTLTIGNVGHRALDMNNNEVAKVLGFSNQAPHLQNFLDCVKSGKRLPLCSLVCARMVVRSPPYLTCALRHGSKRAFDVESGHCFAE